MTKPAPKLVRYLYHDEDYVYYVDYLVIASDQEFLIKRGEEDYVFYVGYLVIASDQKFLIARGEDGDVTELMIPVRNLMMLEDRRGGLRVLRGLPRDCLRSEVPDREWQGWGRHGADDPRPYPTDARG